MLVSYLNIQEGYDWGEINVYTEITLFNNHKLYVCMHMLAFIRNKVLLFLFLPDGRKMGNVFEVMKVYSCESRDTLLLLS